MKILIRSCLIKIIAIFCFLSIASPSYAHPGGTDAYGCHHCYANCACWELKRGEYHCHEKPAGVTEQPLPSVVNKWICGKLDYFGPSEDPYYQLGYALSVLMTAGLAGLKTPEEHAAAKYAKSLRKFMEAQYPKDKKESASLLKDMDNVAGFYMQTANACGDLLPKFMMVEPLESGAFRLDAGINGLELYGALATNNKGIIYFKGKKDGDALCAGSFWGFHRRDGKRGPLNAGNNLYSTRCYNQGSFCEITYRQKNWAVDELITAGEAGKKIQKEVIGVMDGDTVVVEGAGFVDLAGVQCPKLVQADGKIYEHGKTPVILELLLLEEPASISDVRDCAADKQNPEGYFFSKDGTFVNERILKDGKCRFRGDQETEYGKRLFEAEKAAKSQKEGIWAIKPCRRGKLPCEF